MVQFGQTVISFSEVSFAYQHPKFILNETSFSVKRNSKITLMGQNGAGKSTIFGLITKNLEPESGAVNIGQNLTVAMSMQVVPRDQLKLTVKEFFENCFKQKIYNIDPKIDEILEVVNLHAPHDKEIGAFSGGQQARLLLASALIQNPDILLLDEPTNNLDTDGIAHLTKFLQNYDKTVIVISHDADFLNSFTDGVLYLDVFTKKVEQYTGNYFDVTEQIAARLEKERMENARYEKTIQEKKDQANVFAKKGGNLRFVAKRMRDKAEELEEAKVDLRREDKTIRSFVIENSPTFGEVLNISSVTVIKNHKPTNKKVNVSIQKGEHLLLSGPNGIGKSTLLEAVATGKSKGALIAQGVRIGYYRQDFSILNFEDIVYKSLENAMQIGGSDGGEEKMRAVAAGFLISGELMHSKIKDLSEGQKGLLSFARLVLLKPGLLILDEPTNHINFRHLPIIAEALNQYKGAMVLVSHVPDFVKKIRIDHILDLGK